MSFLHTELANHIKAVRAEHWDQLAIDDICLDSLFLTVRLNDGSTGTAMNYDLERSSDLTARQVDDTRADLLAKVAEDPLLWDTIIEPTENLSQQALLIAMLSALSAPVLNSQLALNSLGLTSSDGRIPLKTFQGTSRIITVIGFGGYLEEALAQDWVRRVNCCDFLAKDEGFKARNPYPFQIREKALDRMEVHYDDGSHAAEMIEEADIVCISASTLCNGSLESLLPSEPADRVMILEGPSGGVLPQPLFERGITHLVHNPVDLNLVELCHRFSRQTRKGLQRVSSGRFIEMLLPEQRTVRGEVGMKLEDAKSRERAWSRAG